MKVTINTKILKVDGVHIFIREVETQAAYGWKFSGTYTDPNMLGLKSVYAVFQKETVEE